MLGDSAGREAFGDEAQHLDATPEAAETQVRDGVHVASIRMFVDA